MRNFCAALMATGLIMAPVMASAQTLATGPQVLAPGKPAGVHKAQWDEDNRPLIFVGLAAIGIGIALAVAGNDNNVPANTVTAPSTTTS